MVTSAKKSPFAIDEDGMTLFVKLKYSGIHVFGAFFDGLPLFRFGNEKNNYMSVTDVIAWHEKQLSENNGGNLEILEALRKALVNFRNGKIMFL